VADRANCQIYDYNVNHFSGYTDVPNFANLDFQNSFLQVVDSTSQLGLTTLTTAQAAQAQRFWNEIYLAVPSLINLLKTYSQEYLGFVHSVSVVKHIKASNLYTEWTFPGSITTTTAKTY
jgi:hypothetical protein